MSRWSLLFNCIVLCVRSARDQTAPVNHLTCYFCENVESNAICNRFAIDTPCPPGTSFCRTLHIMDSTGVSLVVNKHCSFSRQCSLETVGCLQQEHQRVCISCCQTSYCNQPVPTNYSNALLEVKPTAPTRAVKSAAATGGSSTSTTAAAWIALAAGTVARAAVSGVG